MSEERPYIVGMLFGLYNERSNRALVGGVMIIF